MPGLDPLAGACDRGSMRLEHTQPGDASEIIDFLRTVFQADGDVPFLAPATIQWKYFTPRPDWVGSRSYVYRDGGRIVAHGCVIPITLPLAAGDVRTISVVDWAAAASIRGIGRSLISDLTALVDARLAFGGSTMGRQLLHRSKLSAPFSSWRRGFRILRPSRLRPASASKVMIAALRWARDCARVATLPFASHGECAPRPCRVSTTRCRRRRAPTVAATSHCRCARQRCSTTCWSVLRRASAAIS